MTDEIELTLSAPRWEYRVVGGLNKFAKISDAEDVLNQFGEEGWELVTMDHDNGWAWLKRVAGLIEVRA